MSAYFGWTYARRKVRQMVDDVIDEWRKEEAWNTYKDLLEKRFATTRRKNELFRAVWHQFMLVFAEEHDLETIGDTPIEVADDAIDKCDVYHMIYDRINAEVQVCIDTDLSWRCKTLSDKRLIMRKFAKQEPADDVDVQWNRLPTQTKHQIMAKYIHWNRKK
jgi:hypothetical protein